MFTTQKTHLFEEAYEVRSLENELYIYVTVDLKVRTVYIFEGLITY